MKKEDVIAKHAEQEAARKAKIERLKQLDRLEESEINESKKEDKARMEESLSI